MTLAFRCSQPWPRSRFGRWVIGPALVSITGCGTPRANPDPGVGAETAVITGSTSATLAPTGTTSSVGNPSNSAGPPPAGTASSSAPGSQTSPALTSDVSSGRDSSGRDSSGRDSAHESDVLSSDPTEIAAPTSSPIGATSGPVAPSDSDPNGPSTGPAPANDFYPCDGASPAEYDVAVTQQGATWTVTKGASQVYAGDGFETALSQAYGALTNGRTAKESILVLGDGEVSASSQLRIPSYTVLNVCGTIEVTGAASGSDKSPLYARGATHIDIPNLVLTGGPQYGIFLRETDDVHLGQIELRLTRAAGIGIRVDSGPNAGSSTDFNRNLTIDHVYGTGMGSHIVETYGIDGIKIGSVVGEDVGECGLLLNRSINAEVGSVDCTGCATGTGYAAFRVANSVGKVGSDFPAGNVHIGKVKARGGGRGIFSVSGCGGIVIDEIDIADTGNTSILMQNTYNTVLAAVSGSVSGGLVQLTNDAEDTDAVYPASRDVTLKNLTLSNGASVHQDWCNEYGSNGCSAINITGGNVSMCP